MTNNNPHIGSSFDEFLDEENLLVEANEIAIKRVIAWQLQQEIESKHMTKTSVAKAMGTSRAAVDRLLDPDNTSVTLNTLKYCLLLAVGWIAGRLSLLNR